MSNGGAISLTRGPNTPGVLINMEKLTTPIGGPGQGDVHVVMCFTHLAEHGRRLLMDVHGGIALGIGLHLSP